MHILIAGGTGTAGRVLTRRALEAGHPVRVLSRSAPDHPILGVSYLVGNLSDGTGLDVAMRGVDAVVDLSNIATASRAAATRFFTQGTEHLIAAEQRAGVGHHLSVSIVGVDALPSGYYQAKVAQEQAVRAASARTGVGHTIARVTQFHDFAALVLRQFKVGPLVLTPPLHVRPVHVDDVAAHLLRLLARGPALRAEELSGPRNEELIDMTRRLVARTRRRLLVVPAPLIGAVRRANNAHALRPAGGVRGTITFDTWLDQQR